MERRIMKMIHRIYPGSSRKKSLDYLDMAIQRCYMKRCPFTNGFLNIQKILSVLNKSLGNFEMSPL